MTPSSGGDLPVAVVGAGFSGTRVIDCIRPNGKLQRVRHELLGELLRAGRIRSDVHDLGLDVEHTGHVRNAVGAGAERMFAVGPITKGEAWEVVAVPDIRRQVWNLARLLAGEHRVGGKGL